VATGLVERLQRELSGRKPSGGEPQTLLEVLGSSNENVLVFYEPTLDKLPAWIRSALPDDVVVEEFPIPRGRELIAWVKRESKGAGATIDDTATQRLLDRAAPGRWREANRNPAYDVPPDLLALSGEIAKLAAYADGSITMDDVDTLVSLSDEDRLFPLVDAITGGDSPSTWRELATLESDDDVGRAYNQVMTTIELGAVTERAGAGSNLPEVAKEMGSQEPQSTRPSRSEEPRRHDRAGGHSGPAGQDRQAREPTVRPRLDRGPGAEGASLKQRGPLRRCVR
jgi:hypothetical protein